MKKLAKIIEYLVLIICSVTLVMLCYELIKSYFASGAFMTCIRVDRYKEYFFEIPVWIAGSALIFKHAVEKLREAIAGEDK